MGEAKRKKGFDTPTDFIIIPPVSLDIKYDGANTDLKKWSEYQSLKYPDRQFIPFQIVYGDNTYDTLSIYSLKIKMDGVGIDNGIVTELPIHTLGQTEKTRYKNAIKIKKKILNIMLEMMIAKMEINRDIEIKGILSIGNFTLF